MRGRFGVGIPVTLPWTRPLTWPWTLTLTLPLPLTLTPLYAATTAVSKSDQKRRLSEQSEFPPLPDFGADGVGTPRSGAADPGRLFLVPFFWRDKRMNPVAGPEPGMVTRQGARIEHRRYAPATKRTRSHVP
ncbi:MAG: hypothetical protein JWR21_1929 [Herminiimonas sp.]|nr:hypothetical protein [Herminiimonas sp.]